MRRYLLCTLAAYTLLSLGCSTATKPAKKARPVAAAPAPAKPKAETVKTAPLYQPPGQTPATAQLAARLHAVEDLLQQGRAAEAKTLADSLNPVDLDDAQKDLLNLYLAQILLSSGEAELALKSLGKITPRLLAPEDKSKYWQAQSFALSLTGNALNSVRARIELDNWLKLPKDRQDNYAAIIEALQLLPGLPQAAQADAQLAGWQSLALLLKSPAADPAAGQAALQQWQDSHPGHPGNGYLQTLKSQPALGAIALLLPGSGVFAQAGEAIKAGFMAAYHSQTGSKPALQFYDTHQTGALELYQQAVAAGAKLVIGPLEKDSLLNLANAPDFPVPVLALNVVPSIQRNNLYQFGLSPADDAEEAVRMAMHEGGRNAILLTPDNDAGKRTADLLNENWLLQDGRMVHSQTYDTRATDHSAAIKQLLLIDESEARFSKIRQYFPDSQYIPRRRQDADLLFLSAYSKEARNINPQLHYLQLGDLPIYATSSVFSGIVNKQQDHDLDGINFCDIPWVFDKTDFGPLSLSALQDVWAKFPSSYLRLVAMGLDAFALGPKLDQLLITPYRGATGNLSLASGNRIKRELTCAQFVNGKPQVKALDGP